MRAIHPRLRCVGSVVFYLCRFPPHANSIALRGVASKACGGVVLLLPAAIKKHTIHQLYRRHLCCTCLPHASAIYSNNKEAYKRKDEASVDSWHAKHSAHINY